MRAFVGLALVGSLAAGCGDDSSETPFDAPDTDAPTDAPGTEEPAPINNGTLTIVEAQVLAPAPGTVNTIVAEGIQLAVTFLDPTIAPQPVLDTNPGTLFRCKVFELTPPQVAAAAGHDEGAVQFTVNNGGTPASPVYPTCMFVPGGSGYICPDPSSGQALTATNSVLLEQINATSSRLTVNAGAATFIAEDIGRHVKFSGTGTGYDAAHIALPISSIMSPNVVILGAPVAAPSQTLSTGMMMTLAGVGPRPGLADPGELADAASATAILTPGGDNHFPQTTITYSDVGDDFTMDNTNADLLRTIPTNGNAFTITCATCGTSVGTILSIVTTDTSVAGQSSTAMPGPTTKRVSIRCAEIGATSITVPASVSAHLATAGATRIQATFIRGAFGATTPANPDLAGVISGHAMVGFRTP